MTFRSTLLLLLMTLFVSCQQLNTTERIVDQWIEVRYDPSLFTAFAWINQGKYDLEDTLSMDEINRKVYSMVYKSLDSGSINSIKSQYQKYLKEYEWMFDYIATIFAINCTPPPVIKPLITELRAYGDSTGETDTWSLNRLMELENWGLDLSDFNAEANLPRVMETVKPFYDSIGSAYRSLAVEKISDVIDYTGISWEALGHIRKVIIVPNLLGPSGEMGPEYMGLKYDIKGPKSQVTFYTHEFLHSVVHPMLQSPDIQKDIIQIVQSRMDVIDSTKAWMSYPDPSLFFEECLVRVLDSHIMNLGIENAGEKITSTLNEEVARGFVLCHELSDFFNQYQPGKSQLKAELPGYLRRLILA